MRTLIEKLKHEASFMDASGKSAVARCIFIVRQHEAAQGDAVERVATAIQNAMESGAEEYPLIAKAAIAAMGDGIATVPPVSAETVRPTTPAKNDQPVRLPNTIEECKTADEYNVLLDRRIATTKREVGAPAPANLKKLCDAYHQARGVEQELKSLHGRMFNNMREFAAEKALARIDFILDALKPFEVLTGIDVQGRRGPDGV